MSYDVKLGYCFSTHFDNFVFCDLIPFCVFGLVGISFKKDNWPSSVVTWIWYVAIVVFIKSAIQKCQDCQTILLSHHNIFYSQQIHNQSCRESKKNSWCDSRGLKDAVVSFYSWSKVAELCCKSHQFFAIVCINIIVIAMTCKNFESFHRARCSSS